MQLLWTHWPNCWRSPAGRHQYPHRKRKRLLNPRSPRTPTEVDSQGNQWDEALHSSPPKLTAAGLWAKKRGRAAVKAPPKEADKSAETSGVETASDGGADQSGADETKQSHGPVAKTDVQKALKAVQDAFAEDKEDSTKTGVHEVRGILARFGAKRIRDLAEDKWAGLIEAAEETVASKKEDDDDDFL